MRDTGADLLRNIVERACALAAGPEIAPAELALPAPGEVPGGPRPGQRGAAPRDEDSGVAGGLQAAERAAIVRALESHQFHRGKAAAELGISLPTLREKIRRYKVPLPLKKWQLEK